MDSIPKLTPCVGKQRDKETSLPNKHMANYEMYQYIIGHYQFSVNWFDALVYGLSVHWVFELKKQNAIIEISQFGCLNPQKN